MGNFHIIWFYISSSAPWIIWKQWNDLLSNTTKWLVQKVHQVMWEALTESTQKSMMKLRMPLKGVPSKNFDAVWCAKDLITYWIRLVVTWQTRSIMGIPIDFPVVPVVGFKPSGLFQLLLANEFV